MIPGLEDEGKRMSPDLHPPPARSLRKFPSICAQICKHAAASA